MNGMIDNNDYKIKDYNNLIKVSKDFKDSIKFFHKEIINHVMNTHYPSITSNINDIGSIISNSHINILELERVLDNLVIVNNRRYGERYSHLLKQDIVNRKYCDPYIVYDTQKIKNTFIILSKLYNYITFLEKNKKPNSAPTNIRRRITLWNVDYVCTILYNTSRSWFQNINKHDIIRFCSTYDVHHNYKCNIFELLHNANIDVISFFKIFSYGLSNTYDLFVFDLLMKQNKWWTNISPNEEIITYILSMLFCMTTFANNKNPFRNRIVYIMFDYVYNILSTYKETIIHNEMFRFILSERCNNFIEELEHMNYETQEYKENLINLCNKILLYYQLE